MELLLLLAVIIVLNVVIAITSKKVRSVLGLKPKKKQKHYMTPYEIGADSMDGHTHNPDGF